MGATKLMPPKVPAFAENICVAKRKTEQINREDQAKARAIFVANTWDDHRWFRQANRRKLAEIHGVTVRAVGAIKRGDRWAQYTRGLVEGSGQRVVEDDPEKLMPVNAPFPARVVWEIKYRGRSVKSVVEEYGCKADSVYDARNGRTYGFIREDMFSDED